MCGGGGGKSKRLEFEAPQPQPPIPTSLTCRWSLPAASRRRPAGTSQHQPSTSPAPSPRHTEVGRPRGQVMPVLILKGARHQRPRNTHAPIGPIPPFDFRGDAATHACAALVRQRCGLAVALTDCGGASRSSKHRHDAPTGRQAAHTYKEEAVRDDAATHASEYTQWLIGSSQLTKGAQTAEFEVKDVDCGYCGCLREESRAAGHHLAGSGG